MHMRFCRNQIGAAIMWGMIPLALWGGLPGTGCICANGQYKFFCAGSLGRVGCDSGRNAASASQSAGCTCPHCRGIATTDAAETSHACCHNDRGQGDPAGKCCHLVARSLATVSAEVAPPTTDALVVAILPPALNLSLVVLSTVSKHVEQIDTGPPIDRVILLRCLLI
jgi:hypothetical protein